jgi:hypothetical protein
MISARAALLCVSVAGAISVTAGSAGQQPSASGFDVTAFDRSVRPQDDLYRYVNGRWLEATPMPDDRVSHTAATELVEKTNDDIRAIIEESPHHPIAGLLAGTTGPTLREHDERGRDRSARHPPSNLI